MIRFILIFFFLITYSYKANSLELIMYDSKYCFYCKKFLKEVGSDYNLPQLPLIVIDDKNQPKSSKSEISMTLINLKKDRKNKHGKIYFWLQNS